MNARIQLAVILTLCGPTPGASAGGSALRMLALPVERDAWLESLREDGDRRKRVLDALKSQGRDVPDSDWEAAAASLTPEARREVRRSMLREDLEPYFKAEEPLPEEQVHTLRELVFGNLDFFNGDEKYAESVVAFLSDPARRRSQDLASLAVSPALLALCMGGVCPAPGPTEVVGAPVAPGAGGAGNEPEDRAVPRRPAPSAAYMIEYRRELRPVPVYGPLGRFRGYRYQPVVTPVIVPIQGAYRDLHPDRTAPPPPPESQTPPPAGSYKYVGADANGYTMYSDGGGGYFNKHYESGRETYVPARDNKLAYRAPAAIQSAAKPLTSDSPVPAAPSPEKGPFPPADPPPSPMKPPAPPGVAPTAPLPKPKGRPGQLLESEVQKTLAAAVGLLDKEGRAEVIEWLLAFSQGAGEKNYVLRAGAVPKVLALLREEKLTPGERELAVELLDSMARNYWRQSEHPTSYHPPADHPDRPAIDAIRRYWIERLASKDLSAAKEAARRLARIPNDRGVESEAHKKILEQLGGDPARAKALLKELTYDKIGYVNGDLIGGAKRLAIDPTKDPEVRLLALEVLLSHSKAAGENQAWQFNHLFYQGEHDKWIALVESDDQKLRDKTIELLGSLGQSAQAHYPEKTWNDLLDEVEKVLRKALAKSPKLAQAKLDAIKAARGAR